MQMFKFKNFRPSLAPDNETPNPALPAGGTGQPPTPPAAVPAPAVSPREQKVITMQRGTYAKQMRDERDRGRQAATADMDKRAKALGFGSVEEMLKKAPKATADPATPPLPVPPRGASPNEGKRYAREVEQARRALDAANKARLAESKRAREAEQRRLQVEAERDLERICARQGIRDTGYAIHLYTRACENKTREELEAMNEEEFFKGLQTQHPYLFGEVEQPATTGTGGSAPAAPSAAEAARKAALAGAPGQFNARTATKAEVDAHMKKLGLSNPRGGSIMQGRR